MRLAAEHLGEGDRARLVFMHGFTQTGRSWRAIADSLPPRYEVVAVDAPGHGGSAAVAADIADGSRLLGEVGGRAVYLGYSMGARFCLRLALDRPDLVTGLSLIGATAGIDDDEERAARRRADLALAASIERDGVDAFIERWLAQPMFATLPHDDGDRADRRRNTAAGLASSLRLAGTAELRPIWDDLVRLAMPVLVMAGALDTRFVALAERIVEAIGPNATLAVIPGAGHAAHLEQPEAFVARLAPWIDAVSATR